MTVNPILEAFRTASPEDRLAALREFQTLVPSNPGADDHELQQHFDAMLEACGRAGWDDPEMSDYDDYDAKIAAVNRVAR